MKKIFIDSDCGIDDASAIMMALASDKVEVNGISAVAGNVGIDNVVHNITRLLSFFGRDDIPVFRGASSSLLGVHLRAGDVHGEDGLGNVFLPETEKKEESMAAPEGLYATAKNNPGLTLVTIGPMTNIAIALNLYPDLKEHIGEIVAMGGAVNYGNVTKFAEFNFAADPEAVQFVIDSGIPLTLVPWDAALKALFTEKDVENLGIGDTKAGKLFTELQKTPMKYFEKTFGGRISGQPDPLAMAYVIDESIASHRIKSGIKMELNYNAMRGSSVTVAGDSIDIIMEINKARFTSILTVIKDLK